MAATAHPRRAPAQAPELHLGARKTAFFALLMVLLALGATEGAVRAYHWARNLGSGVPAARAYLVEDPETGYTLRPGFAAGAMRVNHLGLRGPEADLAPTAGTLRLVALGDSATFGPRDVECAYPYRLPELLAPRRVESLNAAVEGYRTDRALVRLRRDVLPLRPDVVTVYLGWNDLYQTDPRAEDDERSLQASPLARLLLLSDAAQTFRRAFFLHVHAPGGLAAPGASPVVPPGYVPMGYGERLRAIVRTAREGGARVAVLTWPTLLADDLSPSAAARVHYPPYTTRLADLKTLYAAYQARLRTVAAEEGVPVIDTAAAVAAVPDGAGLFSDTAHFNCEGQAVVARAVADGLVAQGLLPTAP